MHLSVIRLFRRRPFAMDNTLKKLTRKPKGLKFRTRVPSWKMNGLLRHEQRSAVMCLHVVRKYASLANGKSSGSWGGARLIISRTTQQISFLHYPKMKSKPIILER